MEQKNPYKVMFIKNNQVILETDWVMAGSDTLAERLVIAKNGGLYGEEVRVLSRPFC